MVLTGIFVSCLGPELIEQTPESESEEMRVGEKVPIVFTASIPVLEPRTKAQGSSSREMNHTPNIESLHLVVFDKEGMYVETAEAVMVDSVFTNEHGKDYHRKFKVTLTLSDKERIIHFIANCPVDQIGYGHEVDVIGNLFVENGDGAYWSRAEVPHIQTLDKTYSDEVGEHFHPCQHLAQHLKHIHLLRNFAEIEVVDESDNENFTLLGFSVYNTINKGTVAPYNNHTQAFQCFVDEDATLAGGKEVIYHYDQLMGIPYDGHALLSAELNSDLPKDANGNYIWYGHNYETPEESHNNFFMYERKVSVRTAEEDKWRESPPHVIVKARYGKNICYYKFDLVYNIMEKGPDGKPVVSDIKYYNILRNFQYHFTIKDVYGPGYDTPEKAMAGITSNNLAGSTTASGFKEITVATDRMTVSFTDTTIVDSGVIHLKYKYEPDFAGDNAVPYNDLVSFVDIEGGDVIASYAPTTDDIASGHWKGYRDVALSIKKPGDITMEQLITVKPQNAYLARKVRLILRKKLNFVVECDPRIFSGMNVHQTVKIKLPAGLTPDMFPLELAIEVKGLSLSPDAEKYAEKGRESIPVHSGKSIVPDRLGQNSFYYTYTLNTYSEYSSITPDEDNLRTVETYWLTNIVNNASTVYVANKYFHTNNDSWTNVANEFSNVKVVTQNISKGLDRDVSISFVMDGDDASSRQRTIAIKLDGLRNPTTAVDDDESVMTISTAASSGNVTVTGNGNARTVTISGLKTTDPEDKVGFTLDCDAYMLASAESGERVTNAFNGRFDKAEVDASVGVPVNYTFDVPTYFDGMVINLTIDGLAPANGDTRLTLVESIGAIRKYSFTPEAAGYYTIRLQTVNKEPSICSIDIETADEYYYTSETATISQAMKVFAGLTISNVRQGVGRPVNVQFVMANDDADFANKNIRVSLVGMRRSSDGATTFTINTGDANAVTRNNRTITLRNIVTSTVADDLTVTIVADDYAPMTATRADRQPGLFTDVALNPTSVGAEGDLPVTLTFNLSADDYYDDMTVYVELDGLVPADGSLEPATRAATQYAYSPSQSGPQTIALKTAADGERTCTAQLTAPGFEDSPVVSTEQTTATHALRATKRTQNDHNYDVQAVYQLGQNLTNGATYELTFYVKADEAINNVGIFLKKSGPGLDNNQNQQDLGNIGNVTTQWTQNRITVSFTANQSGFDMIAFNIGTVPNGKSIYFDKVSLRRTGNNANPNEELITNGDFEDNINNFISNELNNVGPSNTWWLKTNTSVNPRPQCTLEIVTPGHE